MRTKVPGAPPEASCPYKSGLLVSSSVLQPASDHVFWARSVTAEHTGDSQGCRPTIPFHGDQPWMASAHPTVSPLQDAAQHGYRVSRKCRAEKKLGDRQWDSLTASQEKLAA